MIRICALMFAVSALFAGAPTAQSLSCEDGGLTTTMVEVDDGFAGSTPSDPSASLLQFVTGFWDLPLRDFDEYGYEKALAHTFTGLPVDICAAVVTIKVRNTGGGGYRNDTVRFELEHRNRHEPFAWRKVIENIIGRTWEPNEALVLVLDLANLVPGVAGNTDIMYVLKDKVLDVVVEDDTVVDYIKLEVCTQCLPVSAEPATWGDVKAMYR